MSRKDLSDSKGMASYSIDSCILLSGRDFIFKHSLYI